MPKRGRPIDEIVEVTGLTHGEIEHSQNADFLASNLMDFILLEKAGTK